MLTESHYYVSNKMITNSLIIKTIKEQIIKEVKTLIIRLENSITILTDIINRLSTKERFLKKPFNIK